MADAPELGQGVAQLPQTVQERILAFLTADTGGGNGSEEPPVPLIASLSSAAALAEQARPEPAAVTTEGDGGEERLVEPYAVAVAPDISRCKCLEGLAKAVKDRRLVVLDGLLGSEQLGALRAELVTVAVDAKPARVGGGQQFRWADTNARGDRIVWLKEAEQTAAGHRCVLALVQVLKELREALLHAGMDVGGPHTLQLAVYPGGGARYVRHRDASASCPTRRVTAIYYANPVDWDAERDGGCLQVYGVPKVAGVGRAGAGAAATAVGAGTGGATAQVTPRGDRLVVFDSDMEHEVLSTHATRYAVTMWMSCSPPSGGRQAGVATMADTVEESESSLTAAGGGTHQPAGVTACADVEAVEVAPPEVIRPALCAQLSALSCAPSLMERLSSSDDSRIFVSVACYRDPDCMWTLRHLFATATLPHNIRVGVVWQVDAAADAEFVRLAGDQQWQRYVRELRLDYREATGPCKARHLAHSLWSGEEFYLQIDAHTRFAPGWDVTLKDCLARAERLSPKAVLSTYPPGGDNNWYAVRETFENSCEVSPKSGPPPELPFDGEGAGATLPESKQPTVLCAEGFGPEGLLRITGRRMAAPLTRHPLPSLFWAAGFSFSRSLLMAEVPYDPQLPFLFFGEEVSMLARMWTRGWDIFAPPTPVLFHMWTRAARPSNFFQEVPQDTVLKACSQARVLAMLGVGTSQPPPDDLGIYGLGNIRTLAAFCDVCGVDFAHRRISERAKCGGLDAEAFVLD